MSTDWDDETNITDRAAFAPAVAAAEGRDRAYLIVLAGTSVGEMFKLPASEAVIGRGHRADVRLVDDGVSRMHARIRSDGSTLWIEDLGSRNGTLVNGEMVNGKRQLADGDKIQVGRTSILKFTYHDALDESFQQQMYESALRDGLTKVYNKRYFMDRVDGEFRYAHRHTSALAVLMIDVDHFKRINDGHGHPVGDAVLAAIADALARGIRNEDVVARYGGEEFAIISRSLQGAEAAMLGERLRQLIEALTIEVSGAEPLRVTASVGIAVYPAANIESAEQLVDAADRALYAAKRGGRNCVVVA